LTFRPKIIGFVCRWSLPREFEAESSLGILGRPKVHMVQTMCVGRVDPVTVLETFVRGADGVVVVGCPSPDCHYIEGNFQAERKIKMSKMLLSLTGVESERLGLDWAYASEVDRFAKIVDDFRNGIMKLGPTPLAGKNMDKNFLLNVSAARNAAADFRLRLLAGREDELTRHMDVYGDRISQQEFDLLLEEIVQAEYVRHKIHLLASQRPLSIKELAVETGLQPTSVLRHIVEMRRKRTIALDHIETTTPIYKALEVQQK
jgi:F420-non-reducing hydrogenase iron-sulfur subunit